MATTKNLYCSYMLEVRTLDRSNLPSVLTLVSISTQKSCLSLLLSVSLLELLSLGLIVRVDMVVRASVRLCGPRPPAKPHIYSVLAVGAGHALGEIPCHHITTRARTSVSQEESVS